MRWRATPQCAWTAEQSLVHEAKARRGLGRRPHPLYPLVILTVAVILSSCSEGNGAADLPNPSGGEMEEVARPSPSEATTARFEVMLPLSEDGQPTRDALLKGMGDFATGELAYTSFLGGKPYRSTSIPVLRSTTRGM